MRLAIDMTTLILSTICVSDTDGAPISAADIAFMLDVPRENVEASLSDLVANGSVRQDGEAYRINGALSDADIAKILRLNDQIERLRPYLDSIPAHLDS